MIELQEIGTAEQIASLPQKARRLFDEFRDEVLKFDVSMLGTAEGARVFFLRLAAAIETCSGAERVVFYPLHPDADDRPGWDADPSTTPISQAIANGACPVEELRRPELLTLSRESFQSRRAILRSFELIPELCFLAIPYAGPGGSRAQDLSGVFICSLSASEKEQNINNAKLQGLARDVQAIGDILEIRLQCEQQTRMNRDLAALVELNEEIENCKNVRQAREVLCAQLSNYFDLDFIALASVAGGRIRYLTDQGVLERLPTAEVGRTSLQRTLRELVRETANRAKPVSIHHGSSERHGGGSPAVDPVFMSSSIGVHPSLTDDNPVASILGRQMANQTKCENLVCIPDCVGTCGTTTVLIAGSSVIREPKNELQNRLNRFLHQGLVTLERLEQRRGNRLSRLMLDAGRCLVDRKSMVAVFLVSLLFTISLIRMPYRVRCSGVLEPAAKKYVVAPFDGQVDIVQAEIGQVLRPGDLLARLDPTQLEIERSAKRAELQKINQDHDVYLTEGDIPGTLAAKTRAAKLKAEIELLNARIEQTRLVAEQAGVIVHANEQLGRNYSVRKGEELFEIAPLEELVLEVRVPADEVSKVRVGQEVICTSPGNPRDTISGVIESIEPASRLIDGKNVFVARIPVDNAQRLLRPGMDYWVRIEGQPTTVGWSVFHKPLQWIESKFGW